jgi:methylaspartate mutase sigma subunit
VEAGRCGIREQRFMTAESPWAGDGGTAIVEMSRQTAAHRQEVFPVSPIQSRPKRILLSTVSSDSHTWNLVFLQLQLQESGYEVTNLGPCVPDAELIEQVRVQRPDAVVISSVNGHGHLDGRRLIRKLRADSDPALSTVPVMIGGKLGIQGAGQPHLADELVAEGFDAVFTDGADPAEFGTALRRMTAHRPEITGAAA